MVTLDDGTVIEDELAWPTRTRAARAPSPATTTSQKFRALADGVIAPAEQDRFLDCAAALAELEAARSGRPHGPRRLRACWPSATPRGIFDR